MRYRVKSGKIHARINGKMKIYQKGDIVNLDPDDVIGFKDLVEQLDPNLPPPQPKAGLKAVHKGFGKWNVINETTGKEINDKPLTKEEAQELVEAGSSESETNPEPGSNSNVTTDPDLDVTDPIGGA